VRRLSPHPTSFALSHSRRIVAHTCVRLAQSYVQIITGSSSGVGLHTAVALARLNAHVIFGTPSSPDLISCTRSRASVLTRQRVCVQPAVRVRRLNRSSPRSRRVCAELCCRPVVRACVRSVLTNTRR
jgi:NAD(P)-dependent dehydrogenase (short-subunit alcohol dehydrogenase family)